MVILSTSNYQYFSLHHLQTGKLFNASLDPLNDTTEVVLTRNDNAHIGAKAHASDGTGHASAFSGNGLKFIDRSVLMNFHQENMATTMYKEG